MARLTDSEWKVMEALWQGGPQTLGEVLARLAEDTGWSRTTVHTYLTRMMAKGLVAADAQSPRRYSAARSRESCVAEEERSLADRAYGGSAGRLVAAFVRSGQLGREERAELRRAGCAPSFSFCSSGSSEICSPPGGSTGSGGCWSCGFSSPRGCGAGPPFWMCGPGWRRPGRGLS